MKNLFRKLFFSLTIILFNSIVADAGSYPDYTREKNIHNQITSYIFDSDIVELSSKLEQKFNLLATDSSSDTSILLLHGRGLHPSEPNIIDPLRVDLINVGYNVFSLQLPVLEKGKSYNDYFKIFKFSDTRIESALNYIDSKKNIIIAHSCGAHMLLSFIDNIGIGNISGIILLGAGAVDKDQVMKTDINLSSYKISVLNIYAQHDHNSVKQFADVLNVQYSSTQDKYLNTLEVNDADHNYKDQTFILIESVKKWLKAL